MKRDNIENYKEGIRKAIAVYTPYIELLENELASTSTLSYIHGHRCSEEKVKMGKQCRENIEMLRKEVGYEKSTNVEY